MFYENYFELPPKVDTPNFVLVWDRYEESVAIFVEGNEHRLLIEGGNDTLPFPVVCCDVIQVLNVNRVAVAEEQILMLIVDGYPARVDETIQKNFGCRGWMVAVELINDSLLR